jgi:hypothetical protein
VLQYANNPIEAYGSSPAPAGACREAQPLSTDLAAGHALVQNLRRGHYDIATHVPQVTGSAQPSTSSL